ncbi:glucosaminidase domain-containing protein [Aliikangiella maris]|uniref:Glucosaminidase domain-containing protein n=2 Tax=Aliikangiella maris TaxID=3162458 RepID=A0ABV3MIQ5_9GAMM
MIPLEIKDKTLIIGLIMTFCLVAILVHHHRQQPTVEPDKTVELLPDFSKIQPIAERKKAFFNFLRPFIKQENMQIRYDRALLDKLKSDLHTAKHHQSTTIKKIERLAKSYHLELEMPVQTTIDELEKRIDIIPEALVLVQAANESAWGRSRFAKQAYNLFGQWCYTQGCGIIPNSRHEAAKHEVRKFESPQASVKSYMKNLNTHHAYTELRELRLALREQDRNITAKVLAPTLINYSQRREAYVNELIQMIEQNNLE